MLAVFSSSGHGFASLCPALCYDAIEYHEMEKKMAKKKVTKKKATKKKAVEKRPTIAEQVKAEVAKQMPKVETGVVIATPNTTEEKLRAICDLSAAVSNLSKALASTNVSVRVEGCNFQNHNIGLKIGE